MAVDFYLKFEGPAIKGESKNKDYEGQIQIENFNFGVIQHAGLRGGKGGAGGGGGQAEATDLSFTKYLDDSSPLLYKACANGTHFEKVTLTALKPTGTGGQKPYFEALMTTAMISSNQYSGSNGGDATVESVTVNFAKISFKHFIQDKAGNTSQGNIAEYDFQTRNQA